MSQTWECAFNYNEIEADNHIRQGSHVDQKSYGSHKYGINRSRPRHGHKYTKYEMCFSTMMDICIKQHLTNIWSSIYEKVKQH